MKVSDNGLSLTEACEGYRGYPYKDVAGYTTWGFGHKRVGDEPIPTFISIPDAKTLMCSDMGPVEDAINGNVHVTLNQNQFDALADFAFNLGVEALLGSTLLRLLNTGDYNGAAAQFVLWDKAHVDGQVVEVPGLLARRQHERDLFMSAPEKAPTFASTGTAAPAPQNIIDRITSWFKSL